MATVNLNLEGLVDVLKRGVRRAAAFMGLGVNVALDRDYSKVALPNSQTNFKLLPDPLPQAQIDEIKREFKVWIEAAGFRELCESLEEYLTRLYEVAALIHASQDGKIPAGFVLDIPKDFLMKGLARKFEILRDAFDVGPSLPAHLSTLWDVRNCLSHRRGFVGEKDLNESGRLVVRWRGIDTLYVAADGSERLLEVEFEPFNVGEGGGHIAVRLAERVREFSLGERIVLSAHDLSEICWFSLTQSDSLIKSLVDLAERKGVPMTDVPVVAKEDAAVDLIQAQTS